MEGGRITWILDADSSSFNSSMSSAEQRAQKTGQEIATSLGNAASQSEKAFSQLGENLRQAGRNMSLFVTAPIVGGFAASVKSASDFQNTMSQLGVISGGSAGELGKFSAKAQELGRDVSLAGVTAANAADAMVELSKAGLSVNDTLGASRGVLTLAKAGQMDFGQAANFTAAALNAFKLSGDKAVYVADTLANGANASQASLADLALGMQQSSAVSALFGLNLEENITALSIFANNGIRASDAGTSLKSMLLAIATPSKAAAATMKEIGFSAYDAQGNMVSMREMSLRLKESLKGLTEEQKQQALGTIFGSDAIRAAALLADNAGASWDDMAAKVGRSGTAAKVAAAQYGPFRKALEGLMNNVSQLALNVGNVLMPPLTSLFQHLTGLVQSFNSMSPVITTVAVVILGLVAAIGPLLFALGVAFSAVGFYMRTLRQLKAVLIIVKDSQIAANLAFLANPYVLAGVAIAALLVHFIGLKNIVNAITPVIQDIGTVMRMLFTAFTGGTPEVKKGEEGFRGLAGVLSGVGIVMHALYNFVGKQFMFIWQSLSTIFQDVARGMQPMLDKFGEFWKIHGPTIKNILKVVGAVLLGLPFAAVAISVGILGLVLHGLGLAFKFVADHITEIIHVGTTILGVLFTPLKIAIEGLDWVLKQFGTSFSDIWNGIADFMGGVKDRIVNFLKAMQDPIVNLKRYFQEARDFIGQVFSDVFSAISAPFKAAFDAVSGFIEDHKKALINIGIVITTLLLPKIALITFEFGKVVVAAVWQAAQTAAAWVKNAVLASAAWLKELPKMVLEFVKTGLAAAKNAVIASAAWIKNAVLVSAAWIKNLVLMGLQFAWVGVQALIAAGKVALSWMLALGPIGLIVAAVIGIAALIIANWDTVKGWMSSFWNWFTGLISGVIDWVKSNWPLLLAILTGPIGLAVLAIVKNWDTIKEAFGKVKEFFTQVFQSAWDGVVAIWNGIGAFFTTVWEGIKAVFGVVAGWVVTFFQNEWNGFVAIWNAIGAFFGTLWEGIKAVFATVAGWVVTFFQNEWNGFVNIWNAIGAFFSGLWDGIKAVFNTVAGWVVTFFQNEWNGLVNIWNAAAGFFTGVWNGITSIFSNVAGWFGDRFRDAFNGIKNIFSGLWGFFRGVWDNIVGLFGSVGTSVGNAIGNTFKSVINTVISGAVGIINKFIGAINGAIGAINKLPGVNIGKLGTLNVPQLAKGGIALPRPGGQLVNVAEAGQAEVIAPLSKLNDMIRTAVESPRAFEMREPGSAGTTIKNEIGEINIASEVDGENWLQKLTRQDEVTSTGLTY